MTLSNDQIRTRLVDMKTGIDSLLAEIDAPPAPPFVTVKPGDNLPSLLADAVEGTIFRLTQDFRHVGDLRIPKPCTILTYVEAGTGIGRVQPDEASRFAVIQGATVVEATGVTLVNLVLLGQTKGSTVLTTGPQSFVSQCLVRGSALGQHRGIAVNAPGVSVVKSRVENIWSDQDAQAIAGWTGTKDLSVNDCYLEASAEIVLFGGADPASADLIPQDIEIRNCTLSRPLSWKTNPAIVVKNLFELKNAKRVVFAKNECENNWLSGQVGFAVLLTVRNQDGTAPFSTIEDVQILDNTWRHIGAGIQILGRDDTKGKPSQRMQRVVFRRNVFEDMDAQAWGDGTKLAAGRQIQISGGPLDLTFDANTFAGANLNSAITFADADASLPCERLVITGNRFMEGQYGIKGTSTLSGQASLDKFAPGCDWRDNTIIKNPSAGAIKYPLGTTVVSA